MLDLLRADILRLAFDMAPEVEALKAKLARYHNVPMDLADAYLVRMSEQRAGSEVLSLDSDFYIYRDESGQPIPAIVAP